MNDLDRVRFAARNYTNLQGLRIVPFALGQIFLAIFQKGLEWPPVAAKHASWDLTLILPVLLVGTIGIFALKPYYDRRYGFHRRIEPESALGKMSVLFIFAALLAGDYAQVHFGIPVSARGLFFAFIFAGALSTGPRLRWYYGVATAVFALLSILPVFGVGTPNDFFGQYSRISYLAFGIVLLICALMDHRLLTTLFTPVTQEATVEQSV